MVLVQFIITPGNNNTYFTIPISGKCSIRVLNIQYHNTGGTTQCLQLRSDLLFFPYSPARYITWISNPTCTLNYDQGFQEYNLQNVILQGQVQLNVVGSQGEPANNFTLCVVTLQVEHINENFNPKQE